MNKKKGNTKGKILLVILVVLLVFMIILLIVSFNKSGDKISIENEKGKKEYINIPDGFYYVGGTKNSGVIISDNEDDLNRGNEYETTLNLKGNQYVWIPVDNPIADDEKQLEKLIQEKKYPIAIKSGDNYKGVLYDLTFTLNNSPFSIYKGNKDNKDSMDNCNREPAILTMTTYGDNNELIKDSTENLYQDSFNKMVESVKKNKGFFVSRYEIGNLHTDRFTSKALQEDISNLSWIEGYNGIKNMYNNDSVSSEIIWGCQWDAIMIWLYYSDSKDIYFTENTDEFCNHTGSISKTASNQNYSQKNIFDLIGNVSEFTQEAAYSSIRISRGGSYNYETGVNSNNMLIRENKGIIYPYENVGFRSVLIF